MPTLTIRGLDEETHAELRIQAARHGRSMEAHVREILRDAVLPPAAIGGLASQVHARFLDVGDQEVEYVRADEPPRAAEFDS